MLQIYTGNGKGKTTAAIGLAIRFLGHTKRVCLIQFMKKNFSYGEIKFLQQIENIDVFQFGTPDLIDKKNPKEIDFQEADKGIAKAKKILEDAKYDLVILDELNVALDFGLLNLEKVIPIIKKYKNIELVITGRYARPELIELADLVTEMKEIKHYYTNGVIAAKGREF